MTDKTATLDITWSFLFHSIKELKPLEAAFWSQCLKNEATGPSCIEIGRPDQQLFDPATNISQGSSPSMLTTLTLTGWVREFNTDVDAMKDWVPRFMRVCLEAANFIQAVCEYKCDAHKLYGKIICRNTSIQHSYLPYAGYPTRPMGMPDAAWWKLLSNTLDKDKSTVVVNSHGLSLIRDSIPQKDVAAAAGEKPVAPPTIDSIERSLHRIANALEKLVEKWSDAPALTVQKVEVQDTLPGIGVVPCNTTTED